MLLLQLISLFEKEGIEHLVSGGYALCLNGAVRPTIDIDVLIPDKKTAYQSVEWCLSELDFEYLPQDSNSEKKVFKNKNKESILIHIDREFQNYQYKTIKAHSHQIEVIHPEDLIKIKMKNDSAQNIEDISALKSLYE